MNVQSRVQFPTFIALPLERQRAVEFLTASDTTQHRLIAFNHTGAISFHYGGIRYGHLAFTNSLNTTDAQIDGVRHGLACRSITLSAIGYRVIKLSLIFPKEMPSGPELVIFFNIKLLTQI